jgi:hypothetical protein
MMEARQKRWLLTAAAAAALAAWLSWLAYLAVTYGRYPVS